MKVTINPTLDMETMEWVSNDGVYDYDGPVIKFDRSAQAQASNAVNNANTTASTYGTAATGVNSVLTPTLESMATNPTGFSPTDLNNMFVASQQGAGGANSGITGQANLEAARNRNSGGFASALDQAARMKQQTLSGNALGVQNENANLKQTQQQNALKGLEGQYGTDVNAQMKALGLVPDDINAEVNAGKSGWLQDLTGTIGALGSLGSGVGAAAKGILGT